MFAAAAVSVLTWWFLFRSVQAKGVLFNSKPLEKLDKSMKGVEKEKDKEVKEKDKLEKDKEKPKAKPEKEKDKKIPKPRLSTGASSSSSEQSPKPEVTAPNLQNPPSTPKQRGRKPSSAKTPTEIFDFKVVTSEAQKTASVVNDSLRQSPLPGLVPLPVAPVPTITSNSSIVAKETSPVPTQPTVLSPEMLPMSVSSQLKAIPQPSTSILVSDVAKDMNVAAVAAVAPPTKTSTFKETPKQPAAAAPPKKRAAPKNSNEPKRKVGRPPLKSKQSPSAANRKNSSPASTSNTVTSPLNTAFPSSFSQDSQGLASPPSYLSNQSPLFGPSSSHGTGVPQNGPRTPSPNPYMIPQPRSRGQLENGHVLRPNNVNPSPLWVKSSSLLQCRSWSEFCLLLLLLSLMLCVNIIYIAEESPASLYTIVIGAGNNHAPKFPWFPYWEPLRWIFHCRVIFTCVRR